MAHPLQSVAIACLLSALAWSRPAAADCNTDTDCPGPTCGSEVCQWSVASHACVPAGTDVPGYDGACTIDANCKCLGQGATCATALGHCTFTVPQDAGAAATNADASSANTGTVPGCAVGRTGSGAIASMMALGCAASLAIVRRRRRATRAR